MTKITFIGSGGVGSQAAFVTALKKLGDITLIDIVPGLPQGKALDIWHATPFFGVDAKIAGSNDFADSKNSDVIVVTAGVPRKPGMTREDLIVINSKILSSFLPDVAKLSPEAVCIIVTNPLDAMVQLAYKLTGFPKSRVIGMAGALDSARFRANVARACSVKAAEVEAYVFGSHGDTMVPIISQCRVNGKPLTGKLSPEKIDFIVNKVKNAGAEIIALLKNGSTVFAPAAAITDMVEAIVTDSKKIIPCTTILNGEYGMKNMFAGVPVRLGKDGVEEIIELKLSPAEKKDFEKSVAHIKEIGEKLTLG